MLVYLVNTDRATTVRHPRDEHALMVRAAGAAGAARHHLVEDAQAADMILFIGALENGMWPREIWRHPLYRSYPAKCARFSSADRELAWLPGLYAALPARYGCRAFRGGFWPHVAFPDVSGGPAGPAAGPGGGERPYLYSFVGAFDTHRVRRRVGRLRDERALIMDTSAHPGRDHRQSAEVYASFAAVYAETLTASLFVLCPRGVGASSIRLFETLRAGRVPVIIADAWTPPHGPDWAACSLRVRERDIAAIPDLLRRAEPGYPEMAAAAAAAWERFFSVAALFDYAVDTAAEGLAAAAEGEAVSRRFRQAATWRFLRHGALRAGTAALRGRLAT